jgi:hypothetical protein
MSTSNPKTSVRISGDPAKLFVATAATAGTRTRVAHPVASHYAD